MNKLFKDFQIIDNFDDIIKYFDFNFDKNSFYLIQLMIRKKDINKTELKGLITGDNLQLKEFYITSLEDLQSKKEIIKYLCHTTGARAYITPRRYHFENVGFEFLKNLGEQFSNKNFSSIKNKYVSSIIKSKSLTKKWIIDIDTKDKNSFEYLYFTNYLNNKINNNYFEIKTPNGYHFICEPFNLQNFQKEISKIDKVEEKNRINEVSIHKNNSTILYSLCFNEK